MKLLSKFFKVKPYRNESIRERVIDPKVCLCFPVRVEEVHDADTAKRVVIEVPLSVRYEDCWAVELDHPLGKIAADEAKKAEGKKGKLYISLEDADNLADLFTFGRVIGELFIEGRSESERMVKLGFASTKKGGKLGT